MFRTNYSWSNDSSISLRNALQRAGRILHHRARHE